MELLTTLLVVGITAIPRGQSIHCVFLLRLVSISMVGDSNVGKH